MLKWKMAHCVVNVSNFEVVALCRLALYSLQYNMFYTHIFQHNKHTLNTHKHTSFNWTHTQHTQTHIFQLNKHTLNTNKHTSFNWTNTHSTHTNTHLSTEQTHTQHTLRHIFQQNKHTHKHLTQLIIIENLIIKENKHYAVRRQLNTNQTK